MRTTNHSKSSRTLLSAIGGALALAGSPAGGAVDAQATPEYRAKAGFLYNFVAFTAWPPNASVADLPICVYGTNPFGDELRALEGKVVGGRTLRLRNPTGLQHLKGCRVVFIAAMAIGGASRVVESLRGEPVLIVSDVAGALDGGVGINMIVRQNKIVFEVNLIAIRHAQLTVSSKLLRLASEVRQ
jgi:YfiR/HmsC-like